MVQLLPFPLIGLLLFSNSANAWRIDEDCQGEKREFVRQAVLSAFTLNNFGMAVLGSPSPDEAQVIEWLFGTDRGTRTRLRDKLTTLSNINRPDQTKEELGTNDFAVYCTLDRIEKRDEEGQPRYYDPVLEESWTLKNKMMDCKPPILAYTTAPSPDDAGTYPAAEHNIIQLCPWFLDYVLRRDPQFQDDIDTNVFMRAVEKLGTWTANINYTPVDMVTLFDKVLLHEISHTTGAGKTYDVGEWGGWKGYGWKNCRKLSKEITVFPSGDTRREPTTKGPEQNADSIALFGAVSRMLKDDTTIKEDGTFVKRSAQRIKRAIAEFRAYPPFR